MTQAPLLAQEQGVVPVSHHQFHIVVDEGPLDAPAPDHIGNGLIEPCTNGALILTGIAMGVVGVAVEVLASAPPTVDRRWEEIVEVSLEAISVFDPIFEEHSAGELRLNVLGIIGTPGGGDLDNFPLLNPGGPGHYRVRVHANERGHDWDGQSDLDVVPIEEYLIQVWPAPPSPEMIYKAPLALGREGTE